MKFPKGDVVDDLFIFDAHCDTANTLLNPSFNFIKDKQAHLDLEKIRKGGLKAQIFALWVNPIYAPNRAIKKALLLYHVLEKKVFYPGYGKKITSSSEMESTIRNNNLSCLLSLEGGHIIENSIEILEFFYSLGIRSMTLTHTKNTDWADSSGEPPRWDGLNLLGQQIVSRMENLKMIIDLSHSSDKTIENVFDVTSSALMASHSNARALCNIPRNLPDDYIKEIAGRKGFIGVNFFPGFLNKTIFKQINENAEKYKLDYKKIMKNAEKNPDFVNNEEWELLKKYVKGIRKIDTNAVIDHIVHIAEVGGIDCVGLGSDFDGITATPSDLTDVSCYPTLVEGLGLRGFKPNEIRKIMGLNLLNFLKQFDH